MVLGKTTSLIRVKMGVEKEVGTYGSEPDRSGTIGVGERDPLFVPLLVYLESTNLKG